MLNHKTELETALKTFINYLWDNAPEQINLKQEVAEECIKYGIEIYENDFFRTISHQKSPPYKVIFENGRFFGQLKEKNKDWPEIVLLHEHRLESVTEILNLLFKYVKRV